MIGIQSYPSYPKAKSSGDPPTPSTRLINASISGSYIQTRLPIHEPGRSCASTAIFLDNLVSLD
jgi:hypothetical protein